MCKTFSNFLGVFVQLALLETLVSSYAHVSPDTTGKTGGVVQVITGIETGSAQWNFLTQRINKALEFEAKNKKIGDKHRSYKSSIQSREPSLNDVKTNPNADEINDVYRLAGKRRNRVISNRQTSYIKQPIKISLNKRKHWLYKHARKPRAVSTKWNADTGGFWIGGSSHYGVNDEEDVDASKETNKENNSLDENETSDEEGDFVDFDIKRSQIIANFDGDRAFGNVDKKSDSTGYVVKSRAEDKYTEEGLETPGHLKSKEIPQSSSNSKVASCTECDEKRQAMGIEFPRTDHYKSEADFRQEQSSKQNNKSNTNIKETSSPDIKSGTNKESTLENVSHVKNNVPDHPQADEAKIQNGNNEFGGKRIGETAKTDNPQSAKVAKIGTLGFSGRRKDNRTVKSTSANVNKDVGRSNADISENKDVKALNEDSNVEPTNVFAENKNSLSIFGAIINRQQTDRGKENFNNNDNSNVQVGDKIIDDNNTHRSGSGGNNKDSNKSESSKYKDDYDQRQSSSYDKDDMNSRESDNKRDYKQQDSDTYQDDYNHRDSNNYKDSYSQQNSYNYGYKDEPPARYYKNDHSQSDGRYRDNYSQQDRDNYRYDNNLDKGGESSNKYRPPATRSYSHSQEESERYRDDDTRRARDSYSNNYNQRDSKDHDTQVYSTNYENTHSSSNWNKDERSSNNDKYSDSHADSNQVEYGSHRAAAYEHDDRQQVNRYYESTNYRKQVSADNSDRKNLKSNAHQNSSTRKSEQDAKSTPISSKNSSGSQTGVKNRTVSGVGKSVTANKSSKLTSHRLSSCIECEEKRRAMGIGFAQAQNSEKATSTKGESNSSSQKTQPVNRNKNSKYDEVQTPKVGNLNEWNEYGRDVSAPRVNSGFRSKPKQNTVIEYERNNEPNRDTDYRWNSKPDAGVEPTSGGKEWRNDQTNNEVEYNIEGEPRVNTDYRGNNRRSPERDQKGDDRRMNDGYNEYSRPRSEQDKKPGGDYKGNAKARRKGEYAEESEQNTYAKYNENDSLRHKYEERDESIYKRKGRPRTEPEYPEYNEPPIIGGYKENGRGKLGAKSDNSEPRVDADYSGNSRTTENRKNRVNNNYQSNYLSRSGIDDKAFNDPRGDYDSNGKQRTGVEYQNDKETRIDNEYIVITGERPGSWHAGNRIIYAGAPSGNGNDDPNDEPSTSAKDRKGIGGRAKASSALPSDQKDYLGSETPKPISCTNCDEKRRAMGIGFAQTTNTRQT